MTKTRENFEELVGDCAFPGFTFVVREHGLQAHEDQRQPTSDPFTFEVPTTPIYVLQVRGDDPEEGPWSGRKWLLSQHMTDSEVIQTALRATLDAMEHEVREHFTYQGRRPFNPHFDVVSLKELDIDGHHDVRPDNQSMDPA